MRSSRLVVELIEMHGISSDAAKKRVSRIRSPICKFPVPLLPRNEAFLYREQDWKTERFWSALLRDLRETGSVYGIALDGLGARGGFAQRAGFNTVCGTPEFQKKQVPLHRLLENLVRSDLVEIAEIGGLGDCICLQGGFDLAPLYDAASCRARAIAEDILMEGLREWARKLGLASYDAIEIRTAQGAPKFGTFYWDLCGPSYLSPLVSAIPEGSAGPKPGFLVADVFCGETIDVRNIQYLLRKINMSKAMRGMVPFLPLILADGYTKKALRAGRRAGIVMATTTNLFGEAVAKAMSSLIDTITRAAAIAAADPERITKLLNDLKIIEGSSGNLRGALFEMIVGYLVRDVEGASIDIRETIWDSHTRQHAEIDVRRVKGRQECWFYECRTRRLGGLIGEDEIQRWIEKINPILNYHRGLDRFRDCRFGFEFWTNGGFENKALQMLESEKEERKKITLEWRNGQQVREYAKKAKRKSILDALDEHYFNRPWK